VQGGNLFIRLPSPVHTAFHRLVWTPSTLTSSCHRLRCLQKHLVDVRAIEWLGAYQNLDLNGIRCLVL